MNIPRCRILYFCALWALLVSLAGCDVASMVSSKQEKNDRLIEEQMAYHIGVQAYLYGYPFVDMYKQMHNETHRVAAEQQVYAPANRLYRFPEIVGPESGGNLRAPNNDTLYYSGWFDISQEPLIIHTPDTAGRYFTIAVTNLYSEVQHIGRRTFGTQENYFAVVQKGWQGDLPEGVQVIEIEGDRGWLLGRMLVSGKADFNEAMDLVEDIWLATLSEFTAGKRPAMPEKMAAKAIEPIGTLDFFRVMNETLKRMPARPGEAALIAQFDAIGVGPGSDFDESKLSEARRRGLERAIEDGEAIVLASTQRTIPDFNGWMISNEIGRYGYNYMHRAAVVKGGYGNLPEESLYPAVVFDSSGEVMHGDNRYRLHFAASGLPPVNGFWSLAAYRLPDLQLAPNEIERYSIGDRTEGLTFNEDGSLTLWLQHEQPKDTGANWLPTPEGYFMAVMRLYEPQPEALDNSYLLPRVERVD
tara:strand:+ start:109 stop:1524 length:1416 start_codon:yes stop_codon:yes gene_type:complete